MGARKHGRSERIEAQIWAWLDDVPDPEIPVLSVVDLGIVRAVRAGEAADQHPAGEGSFDRGERVSRQ